MDKFLYVFSQEARDKLISIGFTIVNSDVRNDIYTFINDFQPDKLEFAAVSYLTGNTLSL